MKKVVVLLLLVWSVLVVSCDSKDESASKHPAANHYKTVGHQIPTEVGLRWMDLYNERNQTQNRVGFSLYSISSDMLRQMTESVPSLTGVAYHYGIDELGETHIIAIPIDESLRLWTPIPGRIYVDANNSVAISQNVAAQWADNYKAQNPEAIWFHYFGSNVVTEIVANSSLLQLDIIPAISDLDYSPQLLLAVSTDLDLSDQGRSSLQVPIYDASYPCPRCEAQ